MRVIPFSGLVIVTLASRYPRPEGSDTEPESAAGEASVWLEAKGAAMTMAKNTIAENRNAKTLRNLGIDRDHHPFAVDIGNFTEVWAF